MKYLSRFLLLTAGFALIAAGLMMWRAVSFSFDGVWFFDNNYQPHALHLLVLGLAMVPPALWEIFLLEQQHNGS